MVVKEAIMKHTSYNSRIYAAPPAWASPHSCVAGTSHIRGTLFEIAVKRNYFNMKNWKIIFIIHIFLCFVLMSSCDLIKYKKKIENTIIENIDLSTIPDGTYKGYYDVYLVNAKVNVKVKNAKILDIELLEHKHGEGYSGENIINKVLKEQTLKVDAISGATGSCITILKSIAIALKNKNKD